MKDPAALIYIDKFLIATAEMDADCVGWYTKLLLHQYDKGSLPNDIEKLASLCNVRFSEFERFKQVFKQVLEQKFKQNESNRLEQDTAKDIIRKREKFVKKRSEAGVLGVFIKIAKEKLKANDTQIDFLKSELLKIDFEKIKKEDREQMLKQMLEQKTKLYINVDIDINKDIDKEKGGKGEKTNFISKEFSVQWDLWKIYRKKKDKFSYLNIDSEKRALSELLNLADNDEKTAVKIIQQSIDNGWKGFFELKNKKQEKTKLYTGNR